jgi:cytochrome c peroxidase
VRVRVAQDPTYDRLFAAAFPEMPNVVSITQIATAIAAFESTLMNPWPP